MNKETILKVLNEFAETVRVSGVSFPVNMIDEGSFEKLADRLSQGIELEKAEQQLCGYFHGNDGYSMNSLIDSMGLTLNEWNRLKKEYPMNYIRPDIEREIGEYLKALPELPE